MSLSTSFVILEKWFRGFTPLRLRDEPTQFFGRAMGSAHTHKCLHTGRNPVFCGKINNPADLECFFEEALEMSGASCRAKRVSN
jgi:hypothetical protein